MAKASVIARNQKRQDRVKRMKNVRDALRNIIKKDDEKRDEAIVKLQKRSRNESPIRVRNRCQFCGRGKGTLRKFGLCRICFRILAHRGMLPGVVKASW